MQADDIPWKRVVHFHGRAADVPRAIDALATASHADAEKFLARSLEHQDGVVQATPLAVPLILEALREGRSQNPEVVKTILAHFLEAARFQLETFERPDPLPPLEAVIASDQLWPEFESEEQDEALWEEWSPSDEQFALWASLTEQAILAEVTHLGIATRTAGANRLAREVTKESKPWWRFW